MPEEPVQDVVPADQDRRERGWLLWLALAILLAVVAWLMWDYLTRASTGGEVVSVKTTSAQVPTPGSGAQYEYTEPIEDEGDEESASTIPRVVGLMTSTAVNRLEGAGYVAVVTTMYSDTKPTGVVFEQVPAGGGTADPGTKVRVLVSGGSQPARSVKVPDLVGLKKATALDRLEAAGLDARVMVQPRYERVGRVIEQQPAPGKMVSAGSKVFVLVASSY